MEAGAAPFVAAAAICFLVASIWSCFCCTNGCAGVYFSSNSAKSIICLFNRSMRRPAAAEERAAPVGILLNALMLVPIEVTRLVSCDARGEPSNSFSSTFQSSSIFSTSFL